LNFYWVYFAGTVLDFEILCLLDEIYKGSVGSFSFSILKWTDGFMELYIGVVVFPTFLFS
jgi:hypothetical protein